MGRIRVLDPVVANQIAAGEVVERPVSVVKELIENALDAGAARIDVEVEGGGAERIRVADDGCGMEEADARLAFERHATSKIRAAGDLAAIGTYGFRGEALPAIASVSRVTLTTATESAGGGIRVRVHGGRVRAVEPAAHPRGTTVEVEGLFFNAPARRKFLRSRATETARIAEVATWIAAANPAIALSIRSGGRALASWPAAADWEERVRAIVGPETGPALVRIERVVSGMRLLALASGPGISRATARDQVLLVNTRPVRDRRVLHAIQEAYSTILPRGRYPLVYLHLDLPYEEVDVNVHPAKAEVRFLRPAAVHDLVRQALLEGLGVARPFHAWGGPGATIAEPEPGGAWGRSSGSAAIAGAAGFPVPFGGESAAPGGGASPIPGAEAATAASGRLFQAGPAFVPLAQYRETYILAAAPDGLVIVDQHAAHERILYERLLQAEQEETSRQALLFPLTIELTTVERQAFDEAGGSLATLGFDLEPFGERAVVVRAVPSAVAAGDVERLVRDLIAQVLEWRRPEGLEALRHRLAARAACHSAITANQGLDLPRMRSLLAELLKTRRPMTCPHGRPAVIRLAVDHLEKEFRRR